MSSLARRASSPCELCYHQGHKDDGGEPILASESSRAIVILIYMYICIYIRVMDAAGNAGENELDCLHKIILKSGIRFWYMI
jgi:hypothetical protein